MLSPKVRRLVSLLSRLPGVGEKTAQRYLLFLLTTDAEVARELGRELATLHVVPDADHGFHVPKRSGRSDDEVLAELTRTVAAWSADLA